MKAYTKKFFVNNFYNGKIQKCNIKLYKIILISDLKIKDVKMRKDDFLFMNTALPFLLYLINLAIYGLIIKVFSSQSIRELLFSTSLYTIFMFLILSLKDIMFVSRL